MKHYHDDIILIALAQFIFTVSKHNLLPPIDHLKSLKWPNIILNWSLIVIIYNLKMVN